jgi:transcriptional regulator with XRE-family HTH domain
MRFKIWCIEHGYIAKEIEALTGVSRSNIWSYWQGTRKPSRKTENILKEKLGIPSGLFDD